MWSMSSSSSMSAVSDSISVMGWVNVGGRILTGLGGGMFSLDSASSDRVSTSTFRFFGGSEVGAVGRISGIEHICEVGV